MYGVDDDAWPPAVQHEMADRLAAARVVIPKAAHSPAVENPTATTSALVDFWQRV
jgi:pimeloyl-ACP methyl ester carboxylesterase